MKDDSQWESPPLRSQAEQRLESEGSVTHDFDGRDPLVLIHELQVQKIELEMQNEELRCARQHVDKARQRYQDLYEFAPVGYLTLDEKGTISELNLASATLLGLERSFLVKRPLAQFFSPESCTEFELFRRRMVSGKAREHCEVKLANCLAARAWLLVEGIADGNGDERLKEFRVVLTDITERKRMEFELRQAHDVLEQRVAERTTDLADMVNALLEEIEEREKAEEALEKSAGELEDLYNFAPCGYHSLDKDGTIVRVNATELAWLGYERNEIEGQMKATDIMTPESLVVFAKNFPRFRQGHDISDLRLSYIRKDGSILPVLLNATPIMDKNGDYLMSRSTIYDITDLVRAEEGIRRMNQLYLTLSETGKAIARLTDRNELFREICRISVENGGFRMAWIGLVDNESGQVLPAAVFGTGTDYLENIRISALQEPEGMGPTGTVIRNGGHLVCNDFMTNPCTGPWQLEAEKRGFLASASLAISLHGAVIGALILYAGEEDYFDPQIVELLVQMQMDISFALDNLDREARRRETEKALQTEITERLRVVESLRKQEHILIQQNRQAAMGEMIGNIAHQWRQPLNTLGLFTQRLGFFYGTPSFNKEFLDSSVAKSMEIIHYMSRTIDDFRNFFSTEREKMEFRVDDAVRRALSLVEAGFKEHGIHIEKEEREDVIIHGFPNEYAQVLLNIFINARDAIIERKIEFPRLKITIGAEKGVSVVTVADNAGGIPEEIMDKIFDPYFTTKGPQQGTGIGLFMSKSIIENNMGGRITVHNTDLGAEFRIEV